LPNQDNVQIAPAEGKLGILVPGMGAVTTTFIAGLEAIKRGLAKPIGSLTQLGTVRLGKRTEGRSPAIRDFVPLAGINDIEVACWDIFEDNAYEAAVKAGVLEMSLLEQVKEPMQAIKPMKAVFDQGFVKRIHGPNVMSGGSKMDYAAAHHGRYPSFKERTGVARTQMIWCGSTEVYHEAAPVHATLKDFECGLQKNDPEISPSQIYAYAALKSGMGFANGSPHLTTDMPALLELARNMNVPVAGKDYKSGQTFMKTLIAPG
jgi:myo-inositol-1-phosphate synthase